jgi:hypothetical protein
LTADSDKNRVRRVARTFLRNPPTTLAQIRNAWGSDLKKAA